MGAVPLELTMVGMEGLMAPPPFTGDTEAWP
jgi:hypothetical protein